MSEVPWLQRTHSAELIPPKAYWVKLVENPGKDPSITILSTFMRKYNARYNLRGTSKNMPAPQNELIDRHEGQSGASGPLQTVQHQKETSTTAAATAACPTTAATTVRDHGSYTVNTSAPQ